MFNFFSKKTVRNYPTSTRVVKTSRWVHTNELKVGMYVRELDKPWEDTSFMFQGFKVENVKQLHDVQSQAEYVCIESEKLAQVSSNSAHRMCATGMSAAQ